MFKILKKVKIKIANKFDFTCSIIATVPSFAQLKAKFEVILYEPEVKYGGTLSFLDVKQFSYIGSTPDINQIEYFLDKEFKDLEVEIKDIILDLCHISVIYAINPSIIEKAIVHYMGKELKIEKKNISILE